MSEELNRFFGGGERKQNGRKVNLKNIGTEGGIDKGYKLPLKDRNNGIHLDTKRCVSIETYKTLLFLLKAGKQERQTSFG